MDANPVKGTRDMYPEDMRLRTWLFGHWRKVAEQYGFEEYDAPVLESEALYVRKSGEEVTQQLYNFEDKGERRVALRPEMTPSLARMIMARRNGVTLPVKWFSLPQCWRYERMTRGRRREHYQWNMDIWGVQGVEAEAELLAAVVSFFTNIGITSADVGMKVNSRAALGEIMTSLGVPEAKHAATCVLVDKLEKVPLDALRSDMAALGLTDETVTKLLAVMESKSIDALEAAVGADSAAVRELRRLFELAEAYGYADWLVFDASVVRGLAYYTGIVFEGFDRSGALRAICGGGRYDKLLESFGGEALPACGFGFGDAVIVELLKDRNLLPDTTRGTVEALVSAFSPELQGAATSIAAALRQQGRSVDLVIESRKPKWVFKHADRRGARFVCLVAPQEWAERKVNVKDMVTGDQLAVQRDDLATYIAERI
ncbi:histidyl-tRNA synthetase [Tribonema minus]|uniref:histidine--tRNA ligase n=1 Tax=Tribonema minus TaxID=303371 RepID=A0A835Z4P1_9STRA|nr:histidyl-tRNA synthetase [Tribonema minus]